MRCHPGAPARSLLFTAAMNAAAVFHDRIDGGRWLAAALMTYRDRSPVVVALSHGAVPVGYEVARALRAPLDVLTARGFGAPGDGALVLRGGRPALDIRGRTVLLVDDGLACGLTARAAILALRRYTLRALVIAAPVCAPQTLHALLGEVDAVVCARSSADLAAVGQWYESGSQTSDEEVRWCLQSAAAEEAHGLWRGR